MQLFFCLLGSSFQNNCLRQSMAAVKGWNLNYLSKICKWIKQNKNILQAPRSISSHWRQHLPKRHQDVHLYALILLFSFQNNCLCQSMAVVKGWILNSRFQKKWIKQNKNIPWATDWKECCDVQGFGWKGHQCAARLEEPQPIWSCNTNMMGSVWPQIAQGSGILMPEHTLSHTPRAFLHFNDSTTWMQQGKQSCHFWPKCL